jgi:hypothetical protein
MTHPTDSSIQFCAVTLGLGASPVATWLEARPDLDRQMALVAVPSDMQAMSAEFRVAPGIGLGQWLEYHAAGTDVYPASVPPGLKLLVDSGVAVGLDTRHTFRGAAHPAEGEAVVATEVAARTASELLGAVGIVSPAAPALLGALAVHDGAVGFGWQFREGAVTAHVVTRRVKFAGSATCAAIAAEVAHLLPRVLADFAPAETWGAFAENQVRRLRPGEAGHTLDIRIITLPDGTGQRVELDFFALPTRVGVGVVQGFNLPVEPLEQLGPLQGILGTPNENGTVWLDRVRATYGRDGLGVEFGIGVRS